MPLLLLPGLFRPPPLPLPPAAIPAAPAAAVAAAAAAAATAATAADGDSPCESNVSLFRFGEGDVQVTPLVGTFETAGLSIDMAVDEDARADAREAGETTGSGAKASPDVPAARRNTSEGT